MVAKLTQPHWMMIMGVLSGVRSRDFLFHHCFHFLKNAAPDKN